MKTNTLAPIPSGKILRWEILSCIAAGLVLGSAVRAQNLVVNGSFETPVLQAGVGYVPTNGLAPWQTTDDRFELWTNGPGEISADGNQNMEILADAAIATVSQTISTTAGRHYSFSFYHTPRPTVNSILSVSINSQVIATFSENGASLANFQWVNFRTNFTANANTTTIGFTDMEVSGGFSGAGTHIDGVVVSLLDHAGTGTATLTGSFVTGVSITDGGYGYTNTPLVRLIGGGGSGATAFAVVSNGVVTSITVTSAGYGYTNAPLVVIEPPFIPNPVLGIAPMSFLSFSYLTVGGAYQMQQFAGWYWANQPVNFTATNGIYTQMVAGVWGSGNFRLALNPVPSQAFATPQVVNGFVVGATVTIHSVGFLCVCHAQ